MPTGLVVGECGRYDPLHYHALLDPRNDEVRYVGRTFAINMKYRYGTHARGFDPNTRWWVYELATEGAVPRLRVLETVTKDEFSPTGEADWYDHFADQGHDLLNRQRPEPRNWYHRIVKMEVRSDA